MEYEIIPADSETETDVIFKFPPVEQFNKMSKLIKIVFKLKPLSGLRTFDQE